MRMCWEFLNLSKKDLITLSNSLWERSIDDYIESNKKFDGTNRRKIFDKYKDKMKYRKLHCKMVADLCEDMLSGNKEIFVDENQYRYWSNVLYMASLIHDIKKFTADHSYAGAEWIHVQFKKEGYFNECVCEHICDLIRYHKAKEDDSEINDKEPIEKILIVFIRLSDKLSKVVENSKFATISEEEADEKELKLKDNSESIVYSPEFTKNNDFILEKLIYKVMNDFKMKYCNKDIMPLI